MLTPSALNPLQALQSMEALAGSNVQMPNLSQADREQFLQMSQNQKVNKLRHFLLAQNQTQSQNSSVPVEEELNESSSPQPGKVIH